ncbi:cytosine deaminase, partial [Vibrio breoganii]
MTTLLIKNAKLQDQEGLKQILIENGQFSRILDNGAQINHQGDILDAEGGIAV